MTHFQRGFNVSVLMQYNSGRFEELINKIKPWFEDINGNSVCLGNFM